jgi:rubredoxin
VGPSAIIGFSESADFCCNRSTEKNLSTCSIKTTCPACRHEYDVDLGETRIAPGAEHVIVDGDESFKCTSLPFAALLKAYDRGNVEERKARIENLYAGIEWEDAFYCPQCKEFAGESLRKILEKHRGQKKDFKEKTFNLFRASAAKKNLMSATIKNSMTKAVRCSDWSVSSNALLHSIQ